MRRISDQLVLKLDVVTTDRYNQCFGITVKSVCSTSFPIVLLTQFLLSQISSMLNLSCSHICHDVIVHWYCTLKPRLPLHGTLQHLTDVAVLVWDQDIQTYSGRILLVQIFIFVLQKLDYSFHFHTTATKRLAVSVLDCRKRMSWRLWKSIPKSSKCVNSDLINKQSKTARKLGEYFYYLSNPRMF